MPLISLLKAFRLSKFNERALKNLKGILRIVSLIIPVRSEKAFTIFTGPNSINYGVFLFVSAVDSSIVIFSSNGYNLEITLLAILDNI